MPWDRMYAGGKRENNPALAKFQAEFDERQKESFNFVMGHVERYVKAALRDVCPQRVRNGSGGTEQESP